MLQDPENTADQPFQVYASSLEEAQKRCEAEALKLTESGAPAQALGCRQMTFSKTPFRFVCTIRVETR